MGDKARLIRVEDIWNIPNAFTLSRFFLAIPLPFIIMYGEWWWAVLWLWGASFTDYFDGMLARALNKVTGIGEILDIAIDRTLMIPSIIAIVAAGDIMPDTWFAYVCYMVFFMFVMSGDLMVLIGLYLFARMKRKHQEIAYPSPPFVAKTLYAVQLLGLGLVISPIPQDITAVVLIAFCVFNAYAANVFFQKAKWIFFGDWKAGIV